MKIHKVTYAILILVVLGFSACSSSSSPSKFAFSGQLINSTGVAVRNASIQLMAGGVTKYQLTSDTLGKFKLKDVETGAYTINISADGYNIFSSNQTIKTNKDTTFTILGSATISGDIIDSQTGSGLANVTITFYEPLASSAVGSSKVVSALPPGVTGTIPDKTKPVLIAHPLENGHFVIPYVPTGTICGIIQCPNYVFRVMDPLTVTSGDNSLPPSTLVSQPALGEYRIILNWGNSPSDLDTHVTGPTGTGSRFHIYYSQKTTSGASLDVDNTTGYGPETLTINHFVAGTYRYSVYNYSNQSSNGGAEIASSPAKVEIYDHSGLIKTYNAPSFTGTGNTWQVFELNYSGGNVIIVDKNIYLTASSSSDIAHFSKSSDPQYLKTGTNGKTPLNFNITDF